MKQINLLWAVCLPSLLFNIFFAISHFSGNCTCSFNVQLGENLSKSFLRNKYKNEDLPTQTSMADSIESNAFGFKSGDFLVASQKQERTPQKEIKNLENESFLEIEKQLSEGGLILHQSNEYMYLKKHKQLSRRSKQLNAYSQYGKVQSGEAENDSFGMSVAISGDSSVLVAGAVGSDGAAGKNSGSIRIYGKVASGWSQRGPDIEGDAAGDLFGISVDVARNGETIAVGAWGGDYAKLFSWTDEVWIQLGQTLRGEAGSRFGFRVSIASEGLSIAVCAYVYDSYRGKVTVYDFHNNDTWLQRGLALLGDQTSDQFGYSIEISGDSLSVIIGAIRNSDNGFWSGKAVVYSFENSEWRVKGNALLGEGGDDYFGYAVAISEDSSHICVVAGFLGKYVKCYYFQTDSWKQVGQTIRQEDGGGFRSSVGLSLDPVTLVIADIEYAAGNGRVFVYGLESNNWNLLDEIEGEAYNDWFGSQVAVSDDGRFIVAGAPQHDSINGENSGHIKTFVKQQSQGEFCAQSKQSLTINYSVKNTPTESSWELRTLFGNLIEVKSYNGIEPNSSSSSTYCLEDDCYRFVMEIPEGNGMKNGAEYEIIFDGKQIPVLTDFSYIGSVMFGSSCPSQYDSSEKIVSIEMVRSELSPIHWSLLNSKDKSVTTEETMKKNEFEKETESYKYFQGFQSIACSEVEVSGASSFSVFFDNELVIDRNKKGSDLFGCDETLSLENCPVFQFPTLLNSWPFFHKSDRYSGIAVAHKTIFVVEGDVIVEYELNGTATKVFGLSGDNRGNFYGPSEISFDSNNNIFVADTLSHQIKLIDSDSHNITSIVTNVELYLPTDITVHQNGFYYIVNSGNHTIKKISVDTEQLVYEWGGKGKEYGEFNHPYGLAVGQKNQIYVSDSLNNRIQVFDMNGKFLFGWGKFGDGEREFHNPRGIRVNSNGYVHVADVSNGRIQVFTENGIFLTSFKGSILENFSSFGLALDSFDNIHVADATQQGLRLFTAPQFYEYKLNETEKSLNDHRNEAGKWGGFLVSLQSGDENDFVRAIINGETCWIGADKTSEEWSWSDGSDWIYSNIENEFKHDNLVLTTSGKWVGSDVTVENVALYKKFVTDENYCPQQHGTLFIEIIMDGSPEEIQWEVKSDYGNNMNNSIVYEKPFVKYCHALCIPVDTCFTFSIFDTFGDGLTFGGNGRYLVTWEGVVVGGGTDFDYRDDIYINSCRPTNYCVGKKQLKITVNSDHYGRDTTWNLLDESSLKVTGGPYGPEKAYAFEDCVFNICHRFEINDASGDGLCCQYGDGSFVIEFDNTIVEEGGEFEDNRVVYFPDYCDENYFYVPTTAPLVYDHACPIKDNKENYLTEERKWESFVMDLALVGEISEVEDAENLILNQLQVYADSLCNTIKLEFENVTITTNVHSRGRSGSSKGKFLSPPKFVGSLVDPRSRRRRRILSLESGFTFYPKDFIASPCVECAEVKTQTPSNSKTPTMSPTKPCPSSCNSKKKCLHKRFKETCKTCDICKNFCHQKCTKKKCTAGAWLLKCRGCEVCKT